MQVKITDTYLERITDLDVPSAAAGKTARQAPAACGAQSTVTRGSTAHGGGSVPSRIPGRRDPHPR